MPVETEVKFLNVDFEELRAAMKAAGGEFLDKVFEENLVFDDADRSLRKRKTLLRLRRDKKRLLTVKAPAAGDPEHKVQEERQVEVSGFVDAAEALKLLGYAPVFAYEKVRETWRFEGCTVCLDRMPFGNFVEIEAKSSAEIRDAAKRLALDSRETSRKTYHSLHAEWRKKQGLPAQESFVFDPADKARHLHEVGEQEGRSRRAYPLKPS